MKIINKVKTESKSMLLLFAYVLLTCVLFFLQSKNYDFLYSGGHFFMLIFIRCLIMNARNPIPSKVHSNYFKYSCQKKDNLLGYERVLRRIEKIFIIIGIGSLMVGIVNVLIANGAYKHIIIAVSVIEIILMIILIMLLLFVKPRNKCFKNIDHFDQLNEFITDDLQNDERLSLTPLKHWCKKIKYNGREYEIGAYVFSGSDEAKKCCKDVVGKTKMECIFATSPNDFSSTEYVSYRENNLLIIKGKGYIHFIKDLNEMLISFSCFQ